MERVAVIDIGTNSSRLLVAGKSGDSLTAVESGLISTRLGEGMEGGALLPGAMQRTAEAVCSLRQTALRLGAKRVVAVATSAVRDAANKEIFLDLVRQMAGLQVRVLSGEDEAAFSYRGVLAGLEIEPLSTVVVDVGGGSTELIWTQDGRLRLASVNVGAVRVTGAGTGVKEVAGCLSPVLMEIKQSRAAVLVGVGGTITTMAAVDRGLVSYDPAKVHGYSLKAANVDRILKMLKSMSLEERKRVPGLQPERADIIVAGVIIVKLVMEGLGLGQMLVSDCDILYGLALEEVENK